jgi:hypothetical protein
MPPIAQSDPHAGEQFLDPEGFHHIIIGAQIERHPKLVHQAIPGTSF